MRPALVQLVNHVKKNGLTEKYLSDYKTIHSTQTALLYVQNDVLKATDKNSVSMLLLLDLSAAFDTVDSDILLMRLRNCFIKGKCLLWFQDYLTIKKIDC